MTRSELMTKGWFIKRHEEPFIHQMLENSDRLVAEWPLAGYSRSHYAWECCWMVYEPTTVKKLYRYPGGMIVPVEEFGNRPRMSFHYSYDEEDVWRKVIERLNETQ